jgi:outer membrane scaffolding protein for murein synthesis (MipA/OmpV family)
LSVCAPSVFAQGFDAVRLYGAAPGEEGGTVGVAALVGYRYPGSDERRNMLVPGIDYQWKNGWFAGTANGIGVNLSSRPGFDYGLRLTADFGRSESRSSALYGMGDINARPEVGGFLNYAFGRQMVITSSLRYGSANNRHGLLADVGAVYAIELMQQWRLSLGVSATYANADYMQSYFGVDAMQATSSGYKAYAAKAGIRDVRANLSLAYHINPKLFLVTGVSFNSLQGDAKDSPLTRQTQGTTGIAVLSYGF